MRILDQAQIGSSVKVNLKESKDRLNKEIIKDINTSSIATIILVFRCIFRSFKY